MSNGSYERSAYVSPTVAAPPDLDPYTPGRGSLAFSVSRYDLTLDYRLASNRLSGRAIITGKARIPLADISLDLSGLRVSKVQLDSMRVQRFLQRGDRLIITPEERIASGAQFRLDIRYEGNPRPVESLWGDIGWEELTDGVLVAGQPTGASSWFPCNDHPSSKSTYTFRVTTEAGYRVVCNGKLVSRTVKSSREMWAYEQPEPMAAYLATVQIGRYQLLNLHPTAGASGRNPGSDQEPDDDVVPQFAAVPANLAQRAAAGLYRQSEMMETFVRCFGPYPFQSGYTVVVADDFLEIPLEAQSLSILGRNHLSTEWNSQRLVAHELAHQWFGNSVTLSLWRDIWLHEGFACYAEWIWSEASGSLTAEERATAAWRALSLEPQDLLTGDPGAEEMFDDRVYKRGALALHSLRRVCGDGTFFGLLQAWTARFRHGSVTTEDFVELAGSSCRDTDADPKALLDRWLYRTALPDL